MTAAQLVKSWFDTWARGHFHDLPLTDSFTHTSPFGTINGKKSYLEVVEGNRDKFLGYAFNIHDSLYGDGHACVRYTAAQGDFRLDVSEWFYFKENLIDRICSYYHIGEIREERKLAGDEG